MSLKKNDEKFRQNVLTTFQKINDSHGLGKQELDHIKQLLNECSGNDNKLDFIISILQDNIKQNIHLKEQLKILPLVLEGSTKGNLLRILKLLQSTVSSENSKLSSHQADCFASIVIISWKAASNEEDKAETYITLQNFCFENMKIPSKPNQVCGSICMSRLIENCPLIISKNNMNNIWENVMYFLEQKEFEAASELLDCLISLIFAAEHKFKPFSTITLYKVLDFLTDNDWIKRKLSVDIIYTLANYCPQEVMPLRDHIVEFLSVLKSDKVKQVRDACNGTLKYLKDTNFELECKVGTSQAQEETNPSQKEEFKHASVTETNIPSPKKQKDAKSLEGSFSGVLKTDLENKTQPIEIIKTTNENLSTLGKGAINSKTPGNNKSVKTIFSKKDETKDDSKKINKHALKSNHTNPKPGFMVDETEEAYLKTEQNIIRRKDSSNTKTVARTPKLGVSKEKENPKNPKGGRNFTPSRGDISRKKGSNTPEREKSKDKTKSATKISTIKTKIPKGEIKRENSLSIFKGPVNKEFFNNVPTDNNGIQIVVKEKSELSTTNELNTKQASILVSHNEPSDEIYIKAAKNRDLPLKITNKKSAQDNISREKSLERQSIKNDETNIYTKQNETDDKSQGSVVLDKKSSENEAKSLITNEELLKQILLMSEKQAALIESIDTLKQFTIQNIGTINSRLDKLESAIGLIAENKFTDQMSTIPNVTTSTNDQKNSKFFLSPKNRKESKEKNALVNTHSHSHLDTTWNEILLNLKRNNINEAIILCNRNDTYLIKLTGKISMNQIKDVSINLQEEMISKLINILLRHEGIKPILTFFKQVLIGSNLDVKPKLLYRIRDTLINLGKSRLPAEEMTTINLINTYVTEKLSSGKASSHSPLIQSFAKDLSIDTSALSTSKLKK